VQARGDRQVHKNNNQKGIKVGGNCRPASAIDIKRVAQEGNDMSLNVMAVGRNNHILRPCFLITNTLPLFVLISSRMRIAAIAKLST
jgi:hypothetical protein